MGILSASGTQSTAETHSLEIDTRVEVNAGVLAIAQTCSRRTR